MRYKPAIWVTSSLLLVLGLFLVVSKLQPGAKDRIDLRPSQDASPTAHRQVPITQTITPAPPSKVPLRTASDSRLGSNEETALLLEYASLELTDVVQRGRIEAELVPLLRKVGKDGIYELYEGSTQAGVRRVLLWVILSMGDNHELSSQSFRNIEWRQVRDQRLHRILEEASLNLAGDTGLRRLAIQGIRVMPPAQAEQHIRKLLEINDADLVRGATFDSADSFLARGGLPPDLHSLVIQRAAEILDRLSTDEAARRSAAKVLSRDPDRLMALVRDSGGEPSRLVRAQILGSAVEFVRRNPQHTNSAAIVSELMSFSCLLPEDPIMREDLILGLGSANLRPPFGHQIQRTLVAIALSQDHPRVRTAAIQALGQGLYTDAAPILKGLSSDASEVIRSAALASLRDLETRAER